MCPFNDPSVRLSLGPTITPNLLFDFAVVDEIGSVSVNDGAECFAVSPGFGKVLDFDAGISVRQVFAPKQQRAPGRHLLRLTMT